MLEEITNSNARPVPLEISGGHDTGRAPLIGKGMTGVYRIYCTKNGKSYVGSAATCIWKRYRSHRATLRLGKHHSRHLQAAWNKYGESAFVLSILDQCPREFCVLREQFWIDDLNAANPQFGFNISPTAGSCLGKKHTKETLQKLRGMKRSDETREKIRASRIGIKLSNEHRAKIATAGMGRKHTAETIEKMRAWRSLPENKAKFHSYRATPETKEKQRIARIGLRHSEETLKKMRGKKMSAEAIAKTAAWHTGRKRSAETCARISAAGKLFQSKKRGLLITIQEL